MVTVGEMSSTGLENCIGYTAQANHELSMCFNFHHLKVDYKNGDKWALMPPDCKVLKELFAYWQEGMQAEDPDSIFSFYKTLIRLRKQETLISEGEIEFLCPENEDLLAYRRYNKTGELLVLCNLTGQEIDEPRLDGSLQKFCCRTTRKGKNDCDHTSVSS